MMKHSPLIRLQNARRTSGAAQENCPHWDYENPDGGEHECCRRLRECADEVRRAREASR
jgi:hypothetical protein